MTLAARIIHYLLIISIGLLPMAGVNAADIGHDEMMPDKCESRWLTETATQSACDDNFCLSITATCGACSGVSFISATTGFQNIEATVAIDRDEVEAGFRSYLAFLIYRPPIV